MKRLGLDYQVLREANPRLITCSIAGFAGDGPYGDRPAYDAVGQALSGLMSLFVDPKEPRTLGRRSPTRSPACRRAWRCSRALHDRGRTARARASRSPWSKRAWR